MTLSVGARATASQHLAARLGGLYRGWWIAVALALAGFSQSAFVNPVLGVFMRPLHEEFGWSRGMVAGALSAGSIAGAFLGPLIGPLLDRHGARMLMLASGVVMGGALLLLANMHTAWQYYLLYGLGRALTIGVVGMATTVTVANWFIRNRGRATAVTLLGARGGMALGPLFALAAVSLYGWRGAFFAFGCACLLLGCLPCWLFIRRRPEDIGLLPDGAAPGPELAGSSLPSDPRWSAREATRTKAFWLLLFGTTQMFVVSGAVNLSMIPHFEDRGIGSTAAVTVVTVWALLGIPGGIIGSELVNRFGVRVPLASTMVLTAGGIVLLIFVHDIRAAYLFAIAHGLSFGAQMPMVQVVYSEYYGRWALGTISGIIQPVQWVLGGGGPLLASIAYDAFGSYTVPFTVYVAASVLGGLLIFLARPPAHPDASPELCHP